MPGTAGLPGDSDRGTVWGRSLAATLVQDLPVRTAVSFAFATLSIIAIAFLASYGPARRAARVEAMEAVRHE
jgi:ABC-type lipoprotein release transport system permease subunit